jgi:hypothetical protein
MLYVFAIKSEDTDILHANKFVLTKLAFLSKIHYSTQHLKRCRLFHPQITVSAALCYYSSEI